MTDKKLAVHDFRFDKFKTGGENLILRTTFLGNGDDITKGKGYFINQKLELSSNFNSATFELVGITITPQDLRDLANQLESTENSFIPLHDK